MKNSDSAFLHGRSFDDITWGLIISVKEVTKKLGHVCTTHSDNSSQHPDSSSQYSDSSSQYYGSSSHHILIVQASILISHHSDGLSSIMVVLASILIVLVSILIVTPHAQRERGNVIGVGVHIKYIYVCLYVCGPKQFLNRTLAIDSPFQNFAVGLLVEFID